MSVELAAFTPCSAPCPPSIHPSPNAEPGLLAILILNLAVLGRSGEAAGQGSPRQRALQLVLDLSGVLVRLLYLAVASVF